MNQYETENETHREATTPAAVNFRQRICEGDFGDKARAIRRARDLIQPISGGADHRTGVALEGSEKAFGTVASIAGTAHRQSSATGQNQSRVSQVMGQADCRREIIYQNGLLSDKDSHGCFTDEGLPKVT